MRYPSIDVLRTLAIFVMVFVHFSENLSGTLLPIAGLGAPLFVFLSGVSYRLWVAGQVARGKNDLEISKTTIRRGLFVIGTGFVFNILVWLPEDTFIWDVLTFIGTALLILNVARRLPPIIPVLIAAVAIGVSPILQQLVDYPSYWVSKYYEYDFTLSDLLTGFLVAGYFPLFPWIAYSLIGYVTAAGVFSGSVASKERSLPVALSGGGLMALSAAVLAVRAFVPATTTLLAGWRMYPPSLEYVVMTIGMALLLLAVTHLMLDRGEETAQRSSFLTIAKTFSRYSLTIYVLHHLVHLWPLWIYGATVSDDPTEYWMKAMSFPASMALAVLFLGLCYALLRWLGPDERIGIESAMRWLCD